MAVSSITVPDDWVAQIERLADARDRSTSYTGRQLLGEALARLEAQEGERAQDDARRPAEQIGRAA